MVEFLEIITFACVVAFPVIAYLMAKKSASVIMRDLVEVRDATKAQLNLIERITGHTHALVNGRMAAQLHLYAMAMQKISRLTDDPEDVQIAKAAHRQWELHVERYNRDP